MKRWEKLWILTKLFSGYLRVCLHDQFYIMAPKPFLKTDRFDKNNLNLNVYRR